MEQTRVKSKRADSNEPEQAIPKDDIQAMQLRIREADTAEPWDIVGRLLETGWERHRLYYGDYWFMTHGFRRLGITRKTTTDLLDSIFFSDNKAKELGKHPFKMQLEQMIERYDIYKILIEGSWHRILGDDITRRCVMNFLSRWQDKGYGLLLSTDIDMTVKILNEQYALYQKPYSLVANTKGFPDDRVLAFPSGCRGKTGLKLLEVIGSLQTIANSPYDQLLAVDGVGNKRAESIVMHFRRGGKI